MANTQHERHEDSNVTQLNADGEAWKVAAVARGYKLHDGKIWVGANGLLCSAPAPTGFASLAPAFQPHAAQAMLQMAQNRIVQTGEGDVQKLVDDYFMLGIGPKSQTNDAFERHYIGTVADKVNAARPLGDKPTAEAKAAQGKVIEATAEKHRVARFDEFVAAGIAAAKVRPVTEKKRQPKAAANLDAAIDLPM